VNIQADPPATTPALVAPQVTPHLSEHSFSVLPATIPQSKVGEGISMQPAGGYDSAPAGNLKLDSAASSLRSTALNIPSGLQVNSNSLGAVTSFVRAATYLNNVAQQMADAGWISETELSNGQIPVSFCSDTALGVAGDLDVPDTLLHGSVSNVTSSERRESNLDRGSLVFAPAVDSSVKTPFGTVHVDAGSLVLILSFGNGLAVYDLDDSHKNAISVSAEGKKFMLYPGMNLLVTRNSVRGFDEINPAQMFAYRNVSEHALGGGLKAFSTEFFVPMAIQTIAPLKQMMSSNHPHARKMADHLLKTTAATIQMKTGSSQQYRQITRPATTAWSGN
jgi:hypothetical protein